MSDLLTQLLTAISTPAGLRYAHAYFFEKRHPDVTPPFHMELIDLWHCAHKRVIVEAFRGGGKSTIAEEAIALEACLCRFKNAIIIGSSETRAVERLMAVRHEMETNERLREVFGDQVGNTWTEHKLVLKSGPCIQAVGRGQSLRGVKHLGERPDRIFGDDIEDEESTATDAAIDKTVRWFLGVVLPALNTKTGKVRIAATPLAPNSLSVRLMRTDGWLSRSFPVEYISADGQRVASWPDHKPLKWIDSEKRVYTSIGKLDTFLREYMLLANDPTMQAFSEQDFTYDPALHRTWEPTFVMFDPARTTNVKTSATTGKVVYSWVGHKLVVWEASGFFHKPAEILDDIFNTNDRWEPVSIAVEEDGLNEFLMQPIRQEQVKRSTLLPIRAVKAPKNKLGFIKGLEPFFRAREVIFAGRPEDFVTLREQLLSFPTGRIDVPNALAYAPRLRPGQPVYDSFGYAHVREVLEGSKGTPLALAVHATEQFTTGVLLQFADGALRVLSDWVTERAPGNALRDIVQMASMYAGRTFRVYASPDHWLSHNRVGLIAAAGQIPIEVHRAGSPIKGRELIRTLLTTNPHGQPGLLVSREARWTLNAFSAGYAFDVDKLGQLKDTANEGVYKVLMEGVEALAGAASLAVAQTDEKRNYAVAKDGRRYLSALVR